MFSSGKFEERDNYNKTNDYKKGPISGGGEKLLESNKIITK